MQEWICIIALVILGPPIVMVSAAHAVGLKLRNAKWQLEPVDPAKHHSETLLAMRHEQFLAREGFHWVSAYELHGIGSTYVAVWARPGEPTYFCVYVLPSGDLTREFRTVLDGDKSLQTGDRKEGAFLLPPSGNYKQSFKGVDAPEQWQRHVEALRFLTNTGKAKIASFHSSIETILVDGIRDELQHLMSLRCWPVRLAYWYLVQRNRRANRSVQELLETAQRPQS